MDDDSEMYSCPEEQALPPQMIDPNWNVLDHLSPFHQACYMHHQRHRLNHLKALNVYHTDDQHTLLLDEAGFLSAVGVPLPTREQLQRPPPELIFGKEAEQKQNDEQLLSMATQVLEVLQDGPEYRHPTWQTLQQLLETELLHYKTPAALVEAVNDAIKQEEENYSTFRLVFMADFLTTPEASKDSFDKILETICLAMGYRVYGKTEQLKMLSEIDEELSENVLEFRDMYQRMNAHLAQNGTQRTKTAMEKLKRLDDRWERIVETLSPYFTSYQMWENGDAFNSR
ncbi:hypothetical protein BBK36DRAFT_1168815 [Trichoderma citrinoviride]|uniref:Uncharacterized protein n=1 Tax=Trichoderma citrinoviride TaxID=58853 RepID=A0A2T4BA41_9HYPO|nr:hypothetical protein BBK36DRAFT_1168815 [Trichoderma citrinoviride]PTB66195.1 hypothetical protein BBK36DRAFT_1168815 [Trichoderma citrinoviride]